MTNEFLNGGVIPPDHQVAALRTRLLSPTTAGREEEEEYKQGRSRMSLQHFLKVSLHQ